MKSSSALVLFVACYVSFGQCKPQSTTEPAKVTDNSPGFGGFTPQNASDPKYHKLASTGMSKLESLKGERCERKVSKVVEAQSQVVAGMRHILKMELCTPSTCEGKAQTPICEICTLDLWEKPGLNFSEVSKLECPNREAWNYGSSESGQSKPQSTTEPAKVNDNSPGFGGFTSQNASDPKYHKLASTGMGKLESLKGERCERKVSKVVEAQSQVVAGMRHILKMELCSPNTCEGKAQTPICEICTLDLWEKPGLNSSEVSKLECPNREAWNYGSSESGQSKPESTTGKPAEVTDNFGGFTPQNASDPEYHKLASTGMSKLESLKGERCERKVSKVVKAQSQVVAGMRHILKMELCSPNTCEGKAQTPICEICSLDLWEKPWLNFLQVSKLECPNREAWNYVSIE